MDIPFIHSAIYMLDLRISCLKCDILMDSRFDLIYENTTLVSGRTILQQKKNI